MDGRSAGRNRRPVGCPSRGSGGSPGEVNNDGALPGRDVLHSGGLHADSASEAFPVPEQFGLGHPAGASSRATAISADGSTIVGFYEDPVQGFRRPVRWISGSTDLFLGDKLAGEAIGVSSDGSKIVGQASDSRGVGRAFYYTLADGLVSLGVLSGNKTDESVATGVSDNGIAIGASMSIFSWESHPFIWSAKTGLQRLQPLLMLLVDLHDRLRLLRLQVRDLLLRLVAVV